jgi:hypothetical protein
MFMLIEQRREAAWFPNLPSQDRRQILSRKPGAALETPTCSATYTIIASATPFRMRIKWNQLRHSSPSSQTIPRQKSP